MPILADVLCEGAEGSLLDCSHGGITQRDCQPFAVAGVICGGIKFMFYCRVKSTRCKHFLFQTLVPMGMFAF